MLNQLLGSSERERRFNKSRVYKEVLGQQLSLQRLQPVETPPPPPEDPPAPTTPQRYSPSRQLDYHYEDISGWNIREGVKQRLRSKKVFLPQIEGESFGLKRDKPQRETSSQLQTLKDSMVDLHETRVRRQLKDRLESYSLAQEQLEELEEEQYHQTMKQIERINNNLKRSEVRTFVRPHLVYIRQPTLPTRDPPRRMFDHLDRRADFDRYIDYLDKMHSRRYNQQPSRPYEPPMRHATEGNSPSRPRLPQRPYKEQKKQEKKQQKKDGKRENFIKLLRKVKNRGQSLLVKLHKFPSHKSIQK